MKRTISVIICGLVVLSSLLFATGCGKNAYDIDLSKYVQFDGFSGTATLNSKADYQKCKDERDEIAEKRSDQHKKLCQPGICRRHRIRPEMWKNYCNRGTWPGKNLLSVRKRDAVCDSLGMYTADRGGYYTRMCGGRLLCKRQSQNNIKVTRKNLLTDCGC